MRELVTHPDSRPCVLQVHAGVQGPVFLMNFPRDPATAFRRAHFEDTGLASRARQSVNALPNSSHPLVHIHLPGAHSSRRGQRLPLRGFLWVLPLPQVSTLPRSASAPQVAVGSLACLTLPGVFGGEAWVGVQEAGCRGSLHLVAASLTFYKPLVGPGLALGYKGNSSSKKGEPETEVFLSQNRVSLDFWEPKASYF